MAITNVTWDINNKHSSTTLSNNNLTASTTTTNGGTRSTIGKTKGKWYCEFSSTTAGLFTIGIIDDSLNLNTNSSALNTSTSLRAYAPAKQQIYPEQTLYGTSVFSSIDIYSLLLDLDNGKLEFWKNGISMGVSHTNLSSLKKPIYVFSGNVNGYGGSTVTANFGSTSFAYTMPNGYRAYSNETVNKFLILSNDGRYISASLSQQLNAIPLLTSNTSASVTDGIVIRSTENTTYPAWKAFDGIVSTNPLNCWISTEALGWIGFQFNIPTKIIGYSITGREDGSQGHNLKSWTFEASNDGNFWTTLDIQTNITFLPLEKKTFSIINEESFTQYRVKCTENGGAAYKTSLMELSMVKKVGENKVEEFVRSEQNFINHGMDKSTELDLSAEMTNKIFVEQSSTSLGNGKVFRKSIDTTKTPIKKMSIE